MVERMEGYLDRKRLEINVGKTKMMRFRRGGGRMEKMEWRGREERIEEVKEYTYLGYTLQRNGGQEAYVRGRIKKVVAIMGQVWGLGKRRYGKDWGKRLWLFDKLVWTVMGVRSRDLGVREGGDRKTGGEILEIVIGSRV